MVLPGVFIVSSLLAQLKKVTKVVADTGDLAAICEYKPEDATTNPSLIIKALSLPEYQGLVASSIEWAVLQETHPDQLIPMVADKIIVSIGLSILEHVPGRISTEVDARLSYDTEATIHRAKQLVSLYQAAGISVERILIKIAATWQGIKAAEILERMGINCNLTLVFSFAQARACAEAGVFLISPFVGRVLDWYSKKFPDADYHGERDPGVKSVAAIYAYYKKYGYQTLVMGASFRNVKEVAGLAGCDLLTISPLLLAELDQQQGHLPVQLTDPGEPEARPATLLESEFYWQHHQDAMATEKLAQGIRDFAADQEKLELMIRQALA